MEPTGNRKTKPKVPRPKQQMAQRPTGSPESGTYIDGDVYTGGGDFVGRDKITNIIAEPGASVLLDKNQRVNVASEPQVELELPHSIEDFVGRETEIALYEKMLTENHLVVICGMAGLGKTLLASVLANRAAENPGRIFWYSCTRYRADARPAKEELAQNDRAMDGAVDALLFDLAAFLYWNGQKEFWRQLLGERLSDRTVARPSELIGALLKSLRQGKGYVLCFDDFHVVQDDPTFIYLMDRLRNLLPDGNLILIITSRHAPPFLRNTPLQDLQGFGAEDVQRLASERKLSLPLPLCQQLQAKTNGNVTLLAFAIDLIKQSEEPKSLIANLIEQSEDVYEFVLRESFDSLKEDERSVMFAMAVLLGRFGSPNAIASVARDPRSRTVLANLRMRFLIIMRKGSSGVEYAQHSLVQEFYYSLLSESERIDMHGRAADYYASVDALQAADHYQHAGDDAKAAKILSGQLWTVVNRGEAQSLRQILDRFTSGRLDPLSWAWVCLARGQVYALVANNAVARECFRETLALTQAVNASDERRQLRVAAYDGLGRLLEQESPKEALALLYQGLAELKGNEHAVEAMLYGRLGSIQTARGDYEEALRSLEHARALLDQIGDKGSPLRASVVTNLGNIYSMRHSITEGNEAYAEALALAVALHDDLRTMAILSNRGINNEIAGRWHEAEKDYQNALDLAVKLDSVVDRIRSMNSLGTLYTKKGDGKRALAMLDQAIEMARAHDDEEDLAYTLTSRADLCIRQKSFATTEPFLAEAEKLAVELELDLLQAEIDTLWALILIQRGAFDEARKRAEAAVKYAQTQKLTYEEGKFLRTRGLVYAAEQQPDAAIEAYEQSWKQLQDIDPYEAACTELAWKQALAARGSPNLDTS